eukprot:TRINITY_DN2875_c3_g1_i1.p1 TRINITY_DN2875_c3_g1~~TRINITY_DN2875_c3_g1_i1.p1  ORF type:complete len:969 (+),score=298.55 TRINITY_DN2875_c3_g1_i1:72-2909(+)
MSQPADDAEYDGGLFHRKMKEVHKRAVRLRELLKASAVRSEQGHCREISETARWMLQDEYRLVTVQSHLGEALLGLVHSAADPCTTKPSECPPLRAPSAVPRTPADVQTDPAVAAARLWLTADERRADGQLAADTVATVHPTYLCPAVLALLAPGQSFLGTVVHRQHLGALMSATVARPGGVAALADCLLQGIDESESGAYSRVARVLSTPPSAAQSAEHFAAVCPQIAELWVDGDSWRGGRQGVPHRGHLLHYVLDRFASARGTRRVAMRRIVLPVLWPLLLGSDYRPPPDLRRLRGLFDDARHGPPGTVIATAAEVAAAAEAVHRLCSDPHPPKLARLVVPACFLGLLRLHSAVHKSPVSFAAAAEEVLLRYFRLEPDETRARLRAMLAAGLLHCPVEELSDGAPLVLPGGAAMPRAEGDSAALPDVVFAPGPEGGVVVRRSDGADTTQADDCAGVCALMLRLSRTGCALPGDLLLELLRDCYGSGGAAGYAQLRLLRGLCDDVGAQCLKSGRHAAEFVSTLLSAAAGPDAAAPARSCADRPLLELDEPEDPEDLEQKEEALSLALPLLECALAGELKLGQLPEADLRRLDTLLARVQTPQERLQQSAAACRLGIARRLSEAREEGGGEVSPAAAQRPRSVAAGLQECFSLLHGTSDALRSAGLMDLRRLVRTEPAVLREHFDAIFTAFTAHLSAEDSAVYLPCVMGLAALADADAARALPLLLSRYAVRRAGPRRTRRSDAGLSKLPDAKPSSDEKRAEPHRPPDEATLLKLADCLMYCAWRLGEVLPRHSAGFVEAFMGRVHFSQPAAVRASAMWSLGFVASQLRWAVQGQVHQLVHVARDVLRMDTDVLCRRAAAALLQQVMCGLRHDAVEMLDSGTMREVLADARRLLRSRDSVVGEYCRLILESMNEVRGDIMMQPAQSLFTAGPSRGLPPLPVTLPD